MKISYFFALIFLLFPTKESIAQIQPSVEIEMVYVEGGKFRMGGEKQPGCECEGDGKPARKIKVDNFYIGKYEVTQAQWESVMGYKNGYYIAGCPQCPARNMLWEDTQKFIARLRQQTGKNYRLPTEAEWEYAAGGGKKSKGYLYAGSNNADEVAWFKSNSSECQAVGSKQPNELGIYDMSGNVFEWCQDCFIAYWYASRFLSNPQPQPQRRARSGHCRRVSRKKRLLKEGYYYVSHSPLRGGSYMDEATEGCLTTHYSRNRVFWDKNYGFRLVLVP